ncbi:MAG: hypothetical protein OEM59_20455, partial [Rhodospirillales bacterium]|nr:hypothetical protein [Rhodospirillales bacterium]
FHSDVDFLPGSALEFNNESDVFQGGIGYSIGPGIDSSVNVMYADYDTDGGDADGIVGIVGITYSF